MKMRRKFISIILMQPIYLTFFFRISYSASNDCDPRQQGFWINLGCHSRWQQRIEERERKLSSLRAQYINLLSINEDLKIQLYEAHKFIKLLEFDLKESKNTLISLRNQKYTQDSAFTNLHILEREMRFLSDALSSLELLPKQGIPQTIQNTIDDAIKQKNVIDEIIGAIISYTKSKIVTKGLTSIIDIFPPWRFLRAIKKAIETISTLDTFLDISERILRLIK